MPIINPTKLCFAVSPEHGQMGPDGQTPMVAGYRLETVGADTVDLGLPTPDDEGIVDLPLPHLEGGPYHSQVVAYNASGEAASLSSDVYGFTASAADRRSGQRP